MGCLLSVLGNRKPKMKVPRSLEEITASIDWKKIPVSDKENQPASGSGGISARHRLSESPWPNAFAAFLDRTGGPDRAQHFLFLVCCSGLSQQPGLPNETESQLLEEMRQLFFSDAEYWSPNINLKDKDDNVKKIFKIYYSAEGLNSDENRKNLKKYLLELRQDSVIRESLEKKYAEFVKTRSFHPAAHLVQHCIMSLL